MAGVTGSYLPTVVGAAVLRDHVLRLLFDDGHNTGLYTWTLLHELGRDRNRNWARYLERCAQAQ